MIRVIQLWEFKVQYFTAPQKPYDVRYRWARWLGWDDDLDRAVSRWFGGAHNKNFTRHIGVHKGLFMVWDWSTIEQVDHNARWPGECTISERRLGDVLGVLVGKRRYTEAIIPDEKVWHWQVCIKDPNFELGDRFFCSTNICHLVFHPSAFYIIIWEHKTRNFYDPYWTMSYS